MDKKKERLLYISKSKKQLFDSCPLAFKFNYLDKLPQQENPFFIIGINVHDFADKFFDVVETTEDGELRGISKLVYHPNIDYKKNIVKFEIGRWQKINKLGFDSTYFFPVEREKKWITESPKLIGIVDRVHKCCKEDVFAPPEDDFIKGDLVIVENKTGKPNAKKVKGYATDLLWYKIIMEIAMPELAPIKWGAVYFPFDNSVYHYRLTNDDCRVLAKSIKKTRERIKQALETGMFTANPSPYSCKWCQYRDQCEVNLF